MLDGADDGQRDIGLSFARRAMPHLDVRYATPRWAAASSQTWSTPPPPDADSGASVNRYVQRRDVPCSRERGRQGDHGRLRRRLHAEPAPPFSRPAQGCWPWGRFSEFLSEFVAHELRGQRSMAAVAKCDWSHLLAAMVPSGPASASGPTCAAEPRRSSGPRRIRSIPPSRGAACAGPPRRGPLPRSASR